jgi:hypothetical protein
MAENLEPQNNILLNSPTGNITPERIAPSNIIKAHLQQAQLLQDLKSPNSAQMLNAKLHMMSGIQLIKSQLGKIDLDPEMRKNLEIQESAFTLILNTISKDLVEMQMKKAVDL